MAIKTIKEARETISRIQLSTKIYTATAVGILGALIGVFVVFALGASNEAPSRPQPVPSQPTRDMDDNIDGKPGFKKCYTYKPDGTRVETFC